MDTTSSTNPTGTGTGEGHSIEARLGMPVDCTDGHWGELDDFVVDPTTWTASHFVVQPHKHHEQARLVPIDQVTTADGRMTLAMSSEDLESAPRVESTDFIKVQPPRTSFPGVYGAHGSVSSWPYYPDLGTATGLGGLGFTSGFAVVSDPPRYVATKFDEIPAGTVEVRRTSEVVSSDDHKVGTVDGFVIAADGTISHLVLEHGHLWAHRDIAIPVETVRSATESTVRLTASKKEIGDFPSIEFRRPESTATGSFTA